MQPQYKIYATLLDAFNWYLKSEKEESEQEFLDKVNRVPFSSEAAQRGTDFNECVDMAIEGFNDGEDEEKIDKYAQLLDKNEFSHDLIGEIACNKLKGAVPQYFTSRLIQTSKGLVELYGYIDYIQFDKAIDLKTTKSYDLGKYSDSWQRKVYPYCLAGEGIEINAFEFLVTDFNNIYLEPYPVNLEQDEKDIMNFCEHLIEFLETNRAKITDKKIFNQLESA